jgi:threonyl-tRNA synthetase
MRPGREERSAMLKVQLPDGKVVEFAPNTSAGDVVRSIGPGLARKAVAAKFDDKLVDLAAPIPSGPEPTRFVAITENDADALMLIRHSCAHVMAEAICSLWPQTKLVYGPPVEDGFYYDIDLDYNLTPDDFAKIEARMAEIIKQDRPFTRYELDRATALKKLRGEGNEYKVDNAERAEGDALSFYVTGVRDSGCWEDLCRGPHVPSTGRIGAFKLEIVAGAYHHGDATKKMLQRVYGTAFASKKELDAHLKRQEEARKRDHRKIGPELGLFAIDERVGTGLILWKPRGAIMRYQLETFIRGELMARGYQPVYTPHIGKLDLYRTSGHFPYYKDSQFPAIFESDRARELNGFWERVDAENAATATPAELAEYAGFAERFEDVRSGGYPADQSAEERKKRIRTWLRASDGYLLRPMNCPHHICIYGSEARSYRDLPIRLAEFGTVYRYEQSGEVGGLTRVRGFTQDDAHLFCTPDQLHAELAGCVEMTRHVLDVMGMTEYRVRASLRDDSDKYVGSRENWEKSEAAILDVVKTSGMEWYVGRGEAAFYGPKIDFLVKDCIGRDWQLGTVQCDYTAPQRFELRYVGADNKEHRPIMVHRAPLGSIERFCGILIEHFAGAFPTWLAPLQATICTISERAESFARGVFEVCQKAGLRVELDVSGERIGAKIRAATMMKVPYILVVGEQEAAAAQVNVRTRDGKQLGNCSVPQFLAGVAQEIAGRELNPANVATRAGS